jgi:carbon-monoxide dehydrogenase medium subunit
MLYAKPASLEAAVSALGEAGAKALAGGTDLLVRLGRREPWPQSLVDLKAIPELRVLAADDGALRAGAAVTLTELAEFPRLREYPALAEVCRVFGARQVRARATLGGNLANASPAADSVPALIVHGAACRSTRRVFSVEELAQGPGESILADDELIVSVELPRAVAGSRSFFCKLASRDAMAIAVVNVAACLVIEDGSVAQARIALGAVAPTVIRARAAEAELTGAPLDQARIELAADAAMAEASPIDDLRGSARYRRLMIGRLLRYHLGRIAKKG